LKLIGVAPLQAPGVARSAASTLDSPVIVGSDVFAGLAGAGAMRAVGALVAEAEPSALLAITVNRAVLPASSFFS
jgi:hypothetical protein